MSQYAEFQIMTDRYIGPLREIRYLVSTYEDYTLTEAFFQIFKYYNRYRPILGDGNCFYRAVAFSYLREADLTDFNRVFLMTENYCQNSPYKLRSRDLTGQLYHLYQAKLARIQNTYGVERQSALVQVFNRTQNFDTLMIMYLRSINFREIHNNFQFYEPYINTNSSTIDPVENIKIFYKEAEGVEIYSMANALKVHIITHSVGKEGYLKYDYNVDAQKRIDLLFRPGHYDIIYENQGLDDDGNCSEITTPMYSKPNLQNNYVYSIQQHPFQQPAKQYVDQRTSYLRDENQKSDIKDRTQGSSILSELKTSTNYDQRNSVQPIEQTRRMEHNVEQRSDLHSKNSESRPESKTNFPSKSYESPPRSNFSKNLENSRQKKSIKEMYDAQDQQKSQLFEGVVLFLIVSLVLWVWTKF